MVNCRAVGGDEMIGLMHASRRKRAQSGFTLIEALVSLIMFAFIMGALSFAFTTVTKAQDKSEVRQIDN